MMFDLITIGTATLDIVVKSPDFMLTPHEGGVALCETLGSKLDVSDFLMVSGGGATNVAVGCARLGLRSAVVAEVGKDFAAQVIVDDLIKDGVSSEFLVSEQDEQTAVSVLLVAGSGGRTILTHRGAAYQLESRDIPWQQLEQTRWLHFGSLGGHQQLIFDLFDFLQHHEIGCSWTPSMSDLQMLLRGGQRVETIVCDAMIMNREEWETIASLQEQLQRQVPIIIVTAGEAGGEILVRDEQSIHYESEKVQVVEETGAGDAFAAGVISGILHGRSLSECVTWGKKNSISVIQQLGAKAGLLKKEEM